MVRGEVESTILGALLTVSDWREKITTQGTAHNVGVCKSTKESGQLVCKNIWTRNGMC